MLQDTINGPNLLQSSKFDLHELTFIVWSSRLVFNDKLLQIANLMSNFKSVVGNQQHLVHIVSILYRPHGCHYKILSYLFKASHVVVVLHLAVLSNQQLLNFLNLLT